MLNEMELTMDSLRLRLLYEARFVRGSRWYEELASVITKPL